MEPKGTNRRFRSGPRESRVGEVGGFGAQITRRLIFMRGDVRATRGHKASQDGDQDKEDSHR